MRVTKAILVAGMFLAMVIVSGCEDSGICVPSCLGRSCGNGDGCGGTCANCPIGQVCAQDTWTCCNPSCYGKTCGETNDCGIICTNCPAGQVCNQETWSCCAADCTGKCGGPDGCIGSCPDNCVAPETCGGGGVENVCGCIPTTCEAEGKNCGSISDGCGDTLECGTCIEPELCGGGGANVCGLDLLGDLTIDNYPLVDGSTSTLPLDRLIACELFGLPWRWEPGLGREGEAEIIPDPSTPEEQELADRIMEHVFHNTTHQSYLNLVDGAADLIFVANPPSEDVMAYADAAGVTLEWQPLALDALVILINVSNAVRDLTVDEIRSIFMAETIQWSEVGGSDTEIHPYIRPINSGSQQLFNAIVMEGLVMPEWPADRTVAFMGGLINMIEIDELAIGYSVYYYVNYQIPSTELVVDVNSVTPSAETITSGAYPFVAPVLTVIRSDLDQNSLAYRLRTWLLSTDGQAVVGKSGYAPLPP